jgi:hypothetical protein
VLRQLRRDRSQRLEVVERRAAAVEVARAQSCRDQLLEQRRLAPCRGAERAEMPRV